MTVSKVELRRSLLARPLPTNEPSVALLLGMPELHNTGVVAAFASMPSEPSTAALRTALAERCVQVLLPVLLEDNSLEWGADSRDLETGRFGLQTPSGPRLPLAAADVMVVPALAISRSGQRLGRGGGSYDRALAEYRAARPDGLVVAWVLERDLHDAMPVEEHDMPVDAAVTEDRVLLFTPR